LKKYNKTLGKKICFKKQIVFNEVYFENILKINFNLPFEYFANELSFF